MNIITFSKNGLTARFFAVITIVSMLLSAFPVAFFVAQAAGAQLSLTAVPNPTGIDGDLEYAVIDINNAETVDFTGWALVDSDGTELDLTPIGEEDGPQNLTFCANTDPTTNGNRLCFPGGFPTGFNLANTGTLSLKNALGDEVIGLSWTTAGDDELFTDSATLPDTSTPVPDPVFGCIDINATNFDEDATAQGEVECEYPEEVKSQCIDIDQNLFSNGSFEEPEVTNSSKWQKFNTAATGWTTTKVSDETSTTLELQRDLFSNQAADGDQYVELDGDHSTRIAQTIATLQGGEYELSWAFAGRHNAGGDIHNQMDILVNGSSVATEGPQTDPADLASSDWTRSAVTFTADTGSTEIAFADLGPSNSFGTYLDDAQLCLVEEPEAVVNLHAAKIVCDDESELPNFGGTSNPTIMVDFATNWLAENTDTSCRLVEDWEFEWAPKGTSNPGNALVGVAGGDWTTFTGSTEVPAEDVVDDKSFWVREVLPADYIPFAAGKNNVSAEMYCHTDGLNYDNYDRVDNPTEDGDYYCVAWNVPVEKTSTVTMCKYDEDQEALPNWQLALLGEKVDEISVLADGTTQSLTNVPAGEYVLKAQGTYEYRGNTGLLADARFSERKAGDVGFGTYPDQPWKVASAAMGGLAIQVNDDLGVLWGNVFSPAHVYFGSLSQAATADVDFYVYDNAYSDNVGTVDVELFAGRTGLTGKDGCVTFTDVPYGDYEVEELLQAGWTNVSGLGSVVVDADEEVFNVQNTDRVQAPYCGDGEVNQEWEQCEVGDDGCTDYCTLDNQCSDLQLVKITLDDTDSTSFDGSLHLGAADNTIPNGTWFNFNEAGDQSFVTTANAVEGLAIERNQAESKLALAFVGGNGTKKLDIAAGTIMTLGIDLGTVDRAPNASFKLEDGSGASFDDVFDKVGTNINFDLRADTGNDGVSVEINAGEEYDCPECKATVEARVILNDYGTAGNGDLSDEIILGDAGYTTVEFGEWFPISVAANPGDSAVMIADPNTVTNFDSPSDKAGLFVSRESGTVKVALYGKHNPGGNTNHEWIDARIEVRDAGITNYQELSGQFKFENHPENNGVPTNDGYDTASADGTGVDFKLWVDTASDGFRFNIDHDSIASCDEDTKDLMYIDGYKFEQGDDYIAFVEGWSIELYEEGSDVLFAATTTDIDGYYYFEVPQGDYDVYEVMQSGWAQDRVEKNGESIEENPDTESCNFDYYPGDSEQVFQCDFYNVQLGEETFRISGVKYEVEGESDTPAAGWTIYASNGVDAPLSTTTDSDGEYYFDVPAGEWEVYEEDRQDWTLVDIDQYPYLFSVVYSELFEEEAELEIPTSCQFYVGMKPRLPQQASVALLELQSFELEAQEDDYEFEGGYRCDFYNEFEEPETPVTRTGGGGGDATRITRLAEPAPFVLGASTDQCPFLVDYMQMGAENDPMEVMKLQLFLNIFKDMFGGTANPVTGTFGATTDANVKAFQEAFRAEILDPWYDLGIVPHNRPTGFVYKTTLWKINSIVCPEYAVLPELEGETLESNVDIDVNGIQD